MKRLLWVWLLLALCALGARADSFQELCAALAEAGAGRVDAQHKLVVDDQGRPEVACLTPTWALACLVCGSHVADANEALAAIAGQVATSGADSGMLPWFGGDKAGLHATEVAAPLLAAAVLWGGERLTASTASALSAGLNAIGKRLRGAQPASSDVRTLVLAAACAGVGRAEGQEALLARAASLTDAWMKGVVSGGVADGHGPTTEAYRLAALGWLRAFLPERPESWSRAWAITWTDLLQRLTGSGRVLAGTQLYTYPPDAADALGPLSTLLAVALGGPVQAPPLGTGCFALPFREPVGSGLPALSLALPATYAYAWGSEQPYRETLYIAPSYSVATATAYLNAASIPLVITLPERGARPTSYLYVSGACHASALQRGAVAVLNLDFDQIGWRPRTRAWAELVLGPRSTISRVAVLRQPWEGQPIAVDRMWPVAVETGGHYLGVVPLWAGPAEAKEATERIKPGVLQWSGEGEEAELTLRLYARQAEYELARPEDNYVLGCIALVRPATELSFEAFCEELRGIRYKKAFERRTWRVPEKDEGHPILDKHKPKPKRAYHVDTAVDYRLTATIGEQDWVLAEDLYRQEIVGLSIGEEVLPLEPELQFDTPLIKLPPGWSEFSMPDELSSLLLPRP